MALDHFPAIFRRWGDLLRVCDGAEHRDSDSEALRAGESDYPATPEQHGERDAGDRLDGGLWLYHGGFHVVGQRRGVWTLHDVESRLRAVRLDFLAAHGD